jgi:tRNA pseudouridine55 synthase
MLQAVLPEFTGDIKQVPPMYSALKRDGKKLYELAREGKTVEREARDVTVSELELLEGEVELPEFALRMKVSGGTYVRTLVSDIASRCGTRGHMTALRRTRVGRFTIEDALPEEKWKDLDALVHGLSEANVRHAAATE